MGKLSETLKRQAESFHACKKGLRNFPETEQGMIERWKENLDFAVENDFPSVEVIRGKFDRELLHRNLIYVDETVYLPDAPNGVYVLNGACTGVLQFKGFAAATVYLRHESRVTVIADDFAKVFVRLYDEADADVCDVGESVVRVYDRK